MFLLFLKKMFCLMKIPMKFGPTQNRRSIMSGHSSSSSSVSGVTSTRDKEDTSGHVRSSSASSVVYLTPGSEASDIVAPACVGGVLRRFYLSEFTGKFILLLFYPTDFPLVANEELQRFAKALPYFQEMDCEIAAVSANTHFDHLAYSTLSHKVGGLEDKCKFPLIGDPGAYISQKYGMFDRSATLEMPLTLYALLLRLVKPTGTVTVATAALYSSTHGAS
jgi:alkyl hydroperoxide reductase subunit AhpC